MEYRTVIYVKWKLTNRFEIYVNLGKLFAAYKEGELGVARNTLYKKDLMAGYENDTVQLLKCFVK